MRSTSVYTDISLTFEPQSVFEHFRKVRRAVVYDKAAEGTEIEKATFMES